MKYPALTVSLSILCLSVAAWAATPAETIVARQTNFKQLGRAFKGINDELKKGAPDIGVLRTQAAALSQAAARVPGYFPRGTGPEARVKTAALGTIWQQFPQFREKATQLTTSSANLQRAASSGNLALIRAAVPAVGGSCKACHDQFRATP